MGLTALMLTQSAVFAQTSKEVTDLPDISVIGNMIGTQSDGKNDFSVKEIELSFQHYLYPSLKADVFMALHKEDSGQRNFELEEAYVTALDLYGLLNPNSSRNLGLGLALGQKRVNIGKVNPLHPEQWRFVDRPLAIQQFLGGAEGLSAEGGHLNYLLPLPIFSQVELGYWTVQAHAEEAGAEEAHGVEFENKLLNGRLWNSLALSQSQELELGLNYLLGNASSSSTDDQQTVMGLDLTYSKEFAMDRYLKLQAEFYQAKYGEEGESPEEQQGGFLSGVYQFSPKFQAGVRYGTLSKHGDEGNVKNQVALMATRQLSETSKFRLQYNSGDNVTSAVYAQFIFGMGPHSHVLQ